VCGISHLLMELGYALILEEQLLPGRDNHFIQGADLGLQVAELVVLGGHLADQRLHALGHLQQNTTPMKTRLNRLNKQNIIFY